MKFAALLTAGTLSLAVTTLHAQTDVSPNLGAGVGSFTTDRYDPASFTVNPGVVQGRNDVLQITINTTTNAANRPAGFGSSFYNTQGKQTTVNTAGSWLFRSDLFVLDDWRVPAKSGFVRTDMWATATSGASFATVSAYPIIGFSNFGPGGARFRGWNIVGAGGWIDFASTVNFGAWNTLEMSFDAPSNTFTYLVNGIVATQVSDVGPPPTTGVANVMYQAFNFNDANIQGGPPNLDNPDYTVNWSNTAVVPEPSTYALMATGLSFLAAAARRRRRAVAA